VSKAQQKGILCYQDALLFLRHIADVKWRLTNPYRSREQTSLVAYGAMTNLGWWRQK
jgi:hypothetical protein